MKSILRIVSSVGVNCKLLNKSKAGDRFGIISMIISSIFVKTINYTLIEN